jgi:purine-nucleoside/S-methyl-5'-thioadenosine phosphorylase / adenosine deaminase
MASSRSHSGALKDPPPKQPEFLRVPDWSGPRHPSLAWLVHGFSTRIGGRTTVYHPGEAGKFDLNLGFTDSDDRKIVAANRELLINAVTEGKGILGLVTLRQIHSSLIRRAQGKDVQGYEMPAVLKGDGLMTDEPGVLLGIQTADCIPVLVADRKQRAVAAFHAGWRGTLARIVENGVGRMRLEFGSRPEDLIASVGPGIGQCCYAVGEEVQQEFESQFIYASELFREVYDSDQIRNKYPMLFLTARAPGHSAIGPAMHLDLAEANRRQLLAAGLKEKAIFMTGECTGCHTDRFFSHRVERGFTGRMMSVIGIARGGAKGTS